MLMEINRDILNEMGEKVDLILDLCHKDDELQPFALRFQFEQAADTAAFASCPTDRAEHMEKVLKRMADLGREVAAYVLERSLSESKKARENSQLWVPSPPQAAPPDIPRVSSVDDFTVGGDAWLECGANVSMLCVSLMSLVILSNKRTQYKLQTHLMDQHVLPYVNEALKISKDHEMSYFLEGHKTELVRLLANLSFENAKTSSAIVHNTELLRSILSSTSIDEDNPGIGEWAKFTIRNICLSCNEARERIQQLKPLAVDSESEHLLNKSGLSCSFAEGGKCRLQQSPP
eukprot:gene9581-6736_t